MIKISAAMKIYIYIYCSGRKICRKTTLLSLIEVEERESTKILVICLDETQSQDWPWQDMQAVN
jgi:hypothetical protein